MTAVVAQESLEATGRQATDAAIAFLRRGILTGAMPPGSRLNAAQLAAELGMTIVPVREAIHFLAGAGLIELLPLRGARIRNFDREQLIEWWRVFRALTEIELEAVAAEIVRFPEKQSIISSAIAEIRAWESGENPGEFLNSLSDFHVALNNISRQTIVREASRRLQVRFWTSFLSAHVPLETYGRQFANHYAIVADAVCRGDADSAVASFRRHVAWSTALIRGERPEPGAPWRPSD